MPNCKIIDDPAKYKSYKSYHNSVISPFPLVHLIDILISLSWYQIYKYSDVQIVWYSSRINTTPDASRIIKPKISRIPQFLRVKKS